METFVNEFQEYVGLVNDFVWTYILIAGLILLGLYFSFKTKFVQLRYFKEMFRILGDKSMVSAEGKRGISSFQAFSISAASRIGTGNMAGVATAIAGGGPGAVFWMWLIAFLGAASSFVESTLAQIYKVKDKDGFRGGPAYYMEKGLNKRWMGILFAVIITFCFGLVFNSVQSNTISLAFNQSFGISRLWIGIVLAVFTAVIIFGGVKRIAHVSQVLVPVMAVLYLILAIVILMMNVTEIPAMFGLIIESAFGFREAAGGAMGAAVMMGIKRGLFSNEAGMGSAPNAAATAAVTHPAKQGLIQTLGVFVDTILICSATAFIILLSGDYTGTNLTGIELTQSALATHIGSWASYFVAIAILLFAFSSVIGNYYYGETNIEFIKESKTALFVYRLAVIGMVIFGAAVDLEVVWGLADLFMGIMAIINLIAITMLGKIAFAALKDYKTQRREGKDPVFYSDSIPGLKNIEYWETKEQALKKKKLN
ncbi:MULTISPECIES: sodium:alanine symporter family protein [Bacillaceae]|uniref:Sodium:alanine symporter n=1 Tax=Bacillus infantis NRRL B-14911 TaxID=1367477 RepID=U5LA31_9BACI|nr:MULTISPECIES: alanine/glycine:cation symporter family protein [Bacillus]OXT15948.1 sodium:alanine symporter family protein [Bacillus sp. OG2]AGX04270.1 sodium:alanine symporter [Bacillus infantis NRRL B-14911]EAR67032.1 probable amino acid carrier protein [Bacillus sp. NRRL B-14911]MCA1036891.1 alanine:cation symporter family protein [Bacillus infantis]MCK6206988.1 alanine:cation symporter family protein [Bacillus infantis]